MSNQDYRTPRYVVECIFDNIIQIRFDAACTTKDSVADYGCYFDKGQNALETDWIVDGTFCNPPWKQAAKFVEHAYSQWWKYKTEIVMILPASIATNYFHEYIFNHSAVFFPNCRIAYDDPNNPNKKSPMHESMIIFYNSIYTGTFALDLKKYRDKEGGS